MTDGKVDKKAKEALSKYDPSKQYNLSEAAGIVKEINNANFDASVDIDVRLGVDPRKADQMVRGVVALPHGTGKEVKYWCFVLSTRSKRPKMQVQIT